MVKFIQSFLKIFGPNIQKHILNTNVKYYSTILKIFYNSIQCYKKFTYLD